MKAYIEERVFTLAHYILQTGATVRQAAQQHNVSKSTVHKDVTERLSALDEKLADEVKKVLQKNMDERHIRGGLATKTKYEELFM